MKFKSICFVVAFAMLCLFSCAGPDRPAPVQGAEVDISPVEQASLVSEAASKTYLSLYQQYVSLEATLTGGNLKKLKEEVAPVMDKAKRHLINYNDLVIAWRETGETPGNMASQEKLLNAAIVEASALLLEFL